MAIGIPLTKNFVAIVDDEDAEAVLRHKWCAFRAGRRRQYIYASRFTPRTSCLFMHRALLDAPSGVHVDHIDGNGLNNTRANLRLATPGQNTANAVKGLWKRPISSCFKGVSMSSTPGRWAALCARRHIGHFSTQEEAAGAYDEAARHHFGDYARLNFPRPGERSALVLEAA